MWTGSRSALHSCHRRRLSHRVDSKTNRELVGRARGEYVKKLCAQTVAPGVLAYDDGEVAVWAAVAKAADTQSVSGGFPHVLMRLNLQ